MRYQIPIICGPTASGKSALALQISNYIIEAQNQQNDSYFDPYQNKSCKKKYEDFPNILNIKLNSGFKELKVIINAAISLGLIPAIVNIDAYQVYEDITLCSACPTQEEMGFVEHRMFGYVKYWENYGVGRYLHDLKTTLESLISSKKLPIITGGTSMYIYALKNGLTEIPLVSFKTRDLANKTMTEMGAGQFYLILKTLFPNLDVHPNDTRRLLRVYEVWIEHKQYMFDSAYIKKNTVKLDFDFLLCKIIPERSEVYAKSDAKILDMVYKQDAIQEVKKLLDHWDNCKTIKEALLVKELHLYLAGQLTLEDAVSLAQKNTRNFVKRQYTWLKNKLV